MIQLLKTLFYLPRSDVSLEHQKHLNTDRVHQQLHTRCIQLFVYRPPFPPTVCSGFSLLRNAFTIQLASQARKPWLFLHRSILPHSVITKLCLLNLPDIPHICQLSLSHTTTLIHLTNKSHHLFKFVAQHNNRHPLVKWPHGTKVIYLNTNLIMLFISLKLYHYFLCLRLKPRFLSWLHTPSDPLMCFLFT